MISIGRYAAALAMLCAFGAARAQGENSMLSLAQSRNCMSCHSVTRMSMGPAFDKVAEKYAGVEGAHAALARKIVEGGAGVWGPVPMPANTQVTAAQASALADWILSLR
ncbi:MULTISPECIES: c-type cytochrome [unclassified Caballeronia]|uniref:c-type cytochrome n=1 Tax=unclassified Caballeronia TaxID=2646786 RepID=UPI0028638AF7|nr:MULTISPECIES: c-type cytochrome [unclassified Caballeronia]MDR5749805.1 c-type cytochrome [Caballeronia sp. LZ024]MDR5843067.1 c-type cytochrome [Caballeronia sp. LZ031]